MAANSSIEANRSPGTLASAWRQTASSPAGTFARSADTAGTGSWQMRSSSSCTFTPRYGGRPVSISNRMAPRLYTSLAGPMRSSAPWACSGGMYAGVPMTAPTWVSRSPSAGPQSASAGRSAVWARKARPKSVTTGSFRRSNRMFPGFRSRWTMPWRWASAIPRATAAATAAARAGGNGPSRLITSVRVGPGA